MKLAQPRVARRNAATIERAIKLSFIAPLISPWGNPSVKPTRILRSAYLVR
ncbi:DUF1010 domain-containing protein [Comamonas thiooxydans]|uniref:DUF1010 domain-containing protein n=1 Tax=Comamonas thiooxydans TaxID=363952 RepID=UPI0038D4ADDE